MPRVAETFKTVLDKITYGTNFKLLNLLAAENANHTHQNPNTCIEELVTRWHIYLVLRSTSISTTKPSNKG
jgi:hypothetical protein